MSNTRRRLLRLFTVVALITAVLVPAAIAGALPTPENVKCDGVAYHGSNPNHHLLIGGTTLDLRDATEAQFVFMASTVVGPGATVIGSPFDDIICGTPGDDTIKGKAGNDRIFGDGGADLLKGNAGDDVLANSTDFFGAFPSASPGELRGGAGDDYLYAGASFDLLLGQGGDDVLDSFGGAGGAVFSGNNGADTLIGPTGADVYMSGGKGDDTLVAGSGTDQWLSGDLGDDTLSNLGRAVDQVADGGPGTDVISGRTAPSAPISLFWGFGGDGNDTVTGGDGADFLYGDYAAVDTAGTLVATFWIPGPGGTWDTVPGSGDSFLLNNVAGGADLIHGGVGVDDIWGGPGNDSIYGDAGADSFYGLFGDSGDDFIAGGTSGDLLFGGLGNDTMYGNAVGFGTFDTADNSTDLMDGEVGSDTYLGQTYAPGACPAWADTFPALVVHTGTADSGGVVGFDTSYYMFQDNGPNGVAFSGDETIEQQNFPCTP